MKTTSLLAAILLAGLILLAAAPAPAQNISTIYDKWKTNALFAASQNDTSGARNLGPSGILSFVTYTNDTASVYRIFQYRTKVQGVATGSWTQMLRDTISGNGAQIKEAVIRLGSTNLLPGTSCDVRVIHNWQATGQGVSGNEAFYGWWSFRP